MDKVSKEDLMKLSHKDIVRFALFCAYQVKYQWEDIPSDIKCVELVELWLDKKISRQECFSFVNTYASTISSVSIPLCAIYAVNSSAAYTNAYSAAVNTYFYFDPKNKLKLIKEQREYYNELLYIDDIFEKLVLESDIVV